MTNYVKLGKEIANKVRGGNADTLIREAMQNEGLTPEQGQRLVEEVNTQLFYKKMQNGETHEDFPLASPIARDEVGVEEIKTGVKLKKEASFQGFTIKAKHFDLEIPNSSPSMLAKKANVATNTFEIDMMNAEDRWQNTEENSEAIKKELKKEASFNYDFELLVVEALHEATRTSPDLTKTALLSIKHDRIRDEVYEHSKFRGEEIKLSKLASLSELLDSYDKALDKIAGEDKRGFFKRWGHRLSGFKDLALFPFKHPGTTALTAGAVYTALKHKGEDDKMRERLQTPQQSF